MWAKDRIRAKGHPNVKASHRTTLEITRDNYLTPRGDCIIGIDADKGLGDLNESVKALIRGGGYVYLVLRVEDLVDIVTGRGSPDLELSDPNRLIVRKSEYISPSTLMIKSDKSAMDINREIARKLKEGSELTAYVIASDEPLKHEEILRILVDP
ncbi:DUF371 domain-containing protein [Sulfolobales archaeon SCGC AB-777_J03]|nr:DUF371 domain-containing protein [Sulfolobales archaeon SCGC AB-777_J03]